MNWKVKILGAGSLGNHMANASLKKGWLPTLCDIDKEALRRTKTSTFPQRYGDWDDRIRLASPSEVDEENFDLTIIGTPPHTHVELAIKEIENRKSKRILIEKPLAHFKDPNLDKLMSLSQTLPCFIGYNHNCSPGHRKVIELIKENYIGAIQSVQVHTLESYDFILGAHPWLNSVNDTYLGSFQKAGGASFEHSHGIAFGLSILKEIQNELSGQLTGQIEFAPNQEFDLFFTFKAILNNGVNFEVTQNFTEKPPIKKALIKGEKGSITWEIPFQQSRDVVTVNTSLDDQVFEYKKERPTDFLYELDLIEQDEDIKYCNSLQLGKDVLTLIEKTYLSYHESREVSFCL